MWYFFKKLIQSFAKPQVVFVSIAILLSFAIGRMSALRTDMAQNRAIATYEISEKIASTSSQMSHYQSGEVVGSRFGTVYHYPWCKGALSILSEDLVWYPSIQSARNAGRTPSPDCTGLR